MSVATIILRPTNKESDTMENEPVNNEPTIPAIQHPVLVALNEKVDTLTTDNERIRANRDYYLTLANDRYNTIEKMRESIKNFLIENIENVDSDDAKELADFCGIEVTKTMNVSGTITFSGTVEVSIFDEIDSDSMRYNADVTLDVGLGTEEVNNLDYDFEYLDITEY